MALAMDHADQRLGYSDMWVRPEPHGGWAPYHYPPFACLFERHKKEVNACLYTASPLITPLAVVIENDRAQLHFPLLFALLSPFKIVCCVI